MIMKDGEESGSGADSDGPGFLTYCHCAGNCSTVPPATDQVQLLRELVVVLAW